MGDKRLVHETVRLPAAAELVLAMPYMLMAASAASPSYNVASRTFEHRKDDGDDSY